MGGEAPRVGHCDALKPPGLGYPNRESAEEDESDTSGSADEVSAVTRHLRSE